MGWFMIVWISFSIFSALIASRKNRSVVLWFLAGFFFGPFGLLVTLLPSSKYNQEIKLLKNLQKSGSISEDEYFQRMTEIDHDIDKSIPNIPNIKVLLIIILIAWMAIFDIVISHPNCCPAYKTVEWIKNIF